MLNGFYVLLFLIFTFANVSEAKDFRSTLQIAPSVIEQAGVSEIYLAGADFMEAVKEFPLLPKGSPSQGQVFSLSWFFKNIDVNLKPGILERCSDRLSKVPYPASELLNVANKYFEISQNRDDLIKSKSLSIVDFQTMLLGLYICREVMSSKVVQNLDVLEQIKRNLMEDSIYSPVILAPQYDQSLIGFVLDLIFAKEKKFPLDIGEQILQKLYSRDFKTEYNVELLKHGVSMYFMSHGEGLALFEDLQSPEDMRLKMANYAILASKNLQRTWDLNSIESIRSRLLRKRGDFVEAVRSERFLIKNFIQDKYNSEGITLDLFPALLGYFIRTPWLIFLSIVLLFIPTMFEGFSVSAFFKTNTDKFYLLVWRGIGRFVQNIGVILFSEESYRYKRLLNKIGFFLLGLAAAIYFGGISAFLE